jgi:biopolymer transport protein ExbD
MAMPSFDAGDQGGGYRPLSEINVTPLVDVMLVLLIIFMVAAPLLISGVTLELPKAATAPLPEVKEKFVVSVTEDREVFVGDTPVSWHDLPALLSARFAEKGDQTVFVRGARTAEYGTVMELLSELGKAGYADISLLTEEPQVRP